MDRKRERLAENQAFFREINERIEAQGGHFLGEDHLFEFICECASVSCTQPLRATLTEYRAVRERSGHFLVLEGHEVLDIERPVDRNERYLEVETIGG